MSWTENPQSDTRHHAAAIARWDDEGGVFKASPGKKGADEAKNARAQGVNKKEDSHATQLICRR
jgi:hypothetical protein